MRQKPALKGGLLALLLVLALTLGLRVAAIATDGGYVPENDSYDYDRHARSIAAGDGYPIAAGAVDPLSPGETAFRPPAYPLLLGATYAISGDSVTAGRLLGAVLGVAVVLLVYLIATRLWDRRVGLLAALLAAIYPPLVFLSVELYSESLFIALVLAATLCLLRFADDRLERWVVAAGLLVGLAVMTRANGIVLLVPFAIAAWLPNRGRTGSFAAPLILIGLCLAAMAPWTVRNWLTFDEPVPLSTSGGFAAAGVYNEQARDDPRFTALWRAPQLVPELRAVYTKGDRDEAELDGELGSRAREFALDNPFYALEVALWSAMRTFNLADAGTATPDGIYAERGLGVEYSRLEPIAFFALVLLVLVGFAALLRDAGSRPPWWFWLVPAVLLAPALVAIGLPRYRAPTEPWLLMTGALGAVVLCRAAAARLHRRFGVPS